MLVIAAALAGSGTAVRVSWREARQP